MPYHGQRHEDDHLRRHGTDGATLEDAAAIEDAVAGSDAVISLLGPGRHQRGTRDSGLDWTLVRIPLLVDAAAETAVRVGATGIGPDRVGIRLSRPNLAAFLLRTAADDEHVRQAPLIGDAPV